MTAAIHSNPAIIQLTDCPPNPPNPPILPVLLRIQIIFCLLFCLRLSADFMCRRMNERVIIRLLDFLDEEGEVEGGGHTPLSPPPPSTSFCCFSIPQGDFLAAIIPFFLLHKTNFAVVCRRNAMAGMVGAPPRYSNSNVFFITVLQTQRDGETALLIWASVYGLYLLSLL